MCFTKLIMTKNMYLHNYIKNEIDKKFSTKIKDMFHVKDLNFLDIKDLL
jgi:hypothetical protein